jgi:RNAse (barnase) inhibitor barstar
LDGTWINDIPSFYLSLGEAINGPNGYFGAGLDALPDCLNGGFGVLPPLTIRLSHFDEVRNALDGRAWCRFRAEGFHEAVSNGETTEQLTDWGYFGDGSEADIARWTTLYEAALAGKPFGCDEFGSYFDAIVEVLEAGGAEIASENEEASE